MYISFTGSNIKYFSNITYLTYVNNVLNSGALKKEQHMKTIIIAMIALTITACSPKAPDAIDTPGDNFIYLGTGLTYAGNSITTGANPTHSIYKYSILGSYKEKISDYRVNSGESLVKIFDYNSKELLTVVESLAGRRIDLVKKDGSGSEIFLTNSTAFPAGASPIIRDIAVNNGNTYVLKSTGVEKFNSNKTRIMLGANNYVVLPTAGSCGVATASLNLRKMILTASGNIILIQANTGAGNRKLLYIKSRGYTGAGDCLSDVAMPSANDHYPTAVLLHSSGKLFVSYSNGAAGVANHEIWSYDVSDTAITAATKVFSDDTNVRGITDLMELPDGTILASSMDQTFNNIVQLSYDGTALILQKTAFIDQSFDNRSMVNAVWGK